jgi:hypothetical protein
MKKIITPKPWGSEELMALTSGYLLKRLVMAKQIMLINKTSKFI